jgi:GTP-binding protein
MFIDRVSITIKAGNGGNGCISFYRAKYVPNGGPDGGDGGRGGDVIFEADTSMYTLLDFKYKRKFRAENGADGAMRNRSGRSGEDLVIKVPVGTVIREAHSNKVMADLVKPGVRRVLTRGGKGGRGNQHFATATRQAPQYAENGKPTREFSVVLELKLIADVGIIGLPNAGKSTLLSMVTNANPKIADYHFTTLSPNLGVVRNKWGRDFVLADIPGLIEGAADGAGLGHDFLRHVERTKLFIHVVDAAGLEGNDPTESIELINNELKAYDESLLTRPQLIAANKMDIPEARDNLRRIKERWERGNLVVYPISAAANTGLDELMRGVSAVLENYPEDIVFEEDFDEYVDIPDAEETITVEKLSDKLYLVEGPGVERMLGYTQLESEKGFAFFQRFMRERGILERLEALGIAEGDTVRMYELEFDYYK